MRYGKLEVYLFIYIIHIIIFGGSVMPFYEGENIFVVN